MFSAYILQAAKKQLGVSLKPIFHLRIFLLSIFHLECSDYSHWKDGGGGQTEPDSGLAVAWLHWAPPFLPFNLSWRRKLSQRGKAAPLV